jgi:hypothetical protein
MTADLSDVVSLGSVSGAAAGELSLMVVQTYDAESSPKAESVSSESCGRRVRDGPTEQARAAAYQGNLSANVGHGWQQHSAGVVVVRVQFREGRVWPRRQPGSQATKTTVDGTGRWIRLRRLASPWLWERGSSVDAQLPTSSRVQVFLSPTPPAAQVPPVRTGIHRAPSRFLFRFHAQWTLLQFGNHPDRSAIARNAVVDQHRPKALVGHGGT